MLLLLLIDADDLKKEHLWQKTLPRVGLETADAMASAASPKQIEHCMRRSTSASRRQSLRQHKKKKRKKVDDDSDWELEDHASSYDSDDSDDVRLWTSSENNLHGESDDSDYELGSLLKKKSATRRKAKKKDGLRCNECLNSQNAYDPEEGSKVRSLVTKCFFVVKVYFHLF